MYREFYGFTAKPFTISPDPAYLFKSRKHSMGLTMLEYGLASEASIIVLTGEVGCGKTTLTRKLLQHVSNDLTVGLITHTSRKTKDIFSWIAFAFGLEYQGKETASILAGFSEFLHAEHQASRRVVLIVDEAQNLSVDELDEIRMLSNINIDSRIFMQLVLVGQPELLEKLRKPEMRRLTQRISVDYNLEPLNSQETALYIQHRIKVAGVDTEIFDAGSCALVHRESRGIPRIINIICDTALVYGFGDGCQRIDQSVVETVIHDRVLGGLLPVQSSAIPTTLIPAKVSPISGNKSLDLSKLLARPTAPKAAKNKGQGDGLSIKVGGDGNKIIEEMKNNFLSALDRIDSKILEQFSSIREFFRDHIKSKAMENENKKVIIQLIEEGQEPTLTAYLFIRVVLEDFLLDGEYHISRGKLSQNGICYFDLYIVVIRDLYKMDWFSREQARDHCREISEEIEVVMPINQA